MPNIRVTSWGLLKPTKSPFLRVLHDIRGANNAYLPVTICTSHNCGSLTTNDLHPAPKTKWQTTISRPFTDHFDIISQLDLHYSSRLWTPHDDGNFVSRKQAHERRASSRGSPDVPGALRGLGDFRQTATTSRPCTYNNAGEKTRTRNGYLRVRSVGVKAFSTFARIRMAFHDILATRFARKARGALTLVTIFVRNARSSVLARHRSAMVLLLAMRTCETTFLHHKNYPTSHLLVTSTKHLEINLIRCGRKGLPRKHKAGAKSDTCREGIQPWDDFYEIYWNMFRIWLDGRKGKGSWGNMRLQQSLTLVKEIHNLEVAFTKYAEIYLGIYLMRWERGEEILRKHEAVTKFDTCQEDT